MVHQYGKHEMELNPINLKRPSMGDSPEKALKRQISDISLPPSFRFLEEE